MDDLMNRVGALIEEHVKAEVEAQAMIHSIQIKECQARERECASSQTQFNLLRSECDKYRTMWEQLHQAQSEDLNAKEQLKELLSLLGLDGVSPETVKGALLQVRAWDKELREKHGKACAERDEAVRHTQALREKVQALELKLLEVRKAVGEKAPAENAKAPTKPSEFQEGDLVARHVRGPGCWGTVQAVDGDYVQVSYWEGLYWHMGRDLQRKPVEPGDRVRVTGELCGGSPFAGRVGTARAKELGGLYGEWRIEKPEGGHFATCAKLVAAIAAP